MALIETEFNDHVGRVILNDPERHNFLSHQLLEEFMVAFEQMTEKKARAVIIASSEPGVWSAGLDIADLADPTYDPVDYNNHLERALRAVQNFPSPVICKLDGSAWGGACALTFAADIAVGDDRASFAITPVKIGVPYNSSGLILFLDTVGGHIAREMLFTGRPVKAERAYQLGILNHLVERDELEECAADLARRITYNSPTAITVIKEQLRVLSAAQPMNPETYERLDAMRKRALNGADYREGVAAFLAKRKPNFSGE